MSGEMKANPSELRASAHAGDSVASDMKGGTGKALTATDGAAASMSGWSIGAALSGLAGGQRSVLQGLHDRVAAGADNLRSSADGHEWNDEAVAKDFEGSAAQSGAQPMTQTMAAGGAAQNPTIGAPGAVGSEGSYPMPGADKQRDLFMGRDNWTTGPAPASPTDRAVFGGSGNTTQPQRDPGFQWTEERMRNAKPMPLPNPDPGAYPGPDPGAKWTEEDMRNAKPMPLLDPDAGTSHRMPEPDKKWTPEEMAKAKPMSAPGSDSPFG